MKIPSSDNKSNIQVIDIGVWKILRERKWGNLPIPNLEGPRELLQCLPFVYRLIREVTVLGPLPMIVSLLCYISSSCITAVDLYCSAQILDVVQQLVLQRELVVEGALTRAFLAKLLCTLVSWTGNVAREWCDPILETRTDRIYKKILLEAHLRLDLATSENEEMRGKFRGLQYGSGWSNLSQIFAIVGQIVQILSQGAFVVGFFGKQQDGLILATMCMAEPLLNSVFGMNMWYNGVWFAHVDNLPWLRMNALQELGTKPKFHKEVLGDGLTELLQQEYLKAKTAVGDIPERDPYNQRETFQQYMVNLASMTLQQAPLFLLALRAYQSPSTFSLTSFGMIQETTNTVKYTVYGLLHTGSSILHSFRGVKNIYELLSIQNAMSDGDTPYPTPDKEKHSPGMTIEFRNVSFTYPGSEKQALKDISFTMKAGQLIVIVGENGSGKTSTVSLLNRMTEPTSGEILVDGLPMKSLRMADLRRACAILCQDYHHYPLTISENIGFGDPKNFEDDTRIQKAADLAGAKETIEALPNGFNTNLTPITHTMQSWRPIEGTEVGKVATEITKPVAKFSGGQWQRLALARTFMRALSEDVKLVCCDEPSAALDPRAEGEVFERLRTVVAEKTRIFITHRFGHLTKYADLILCMKDGRLVEQGTHAELIKLGGEYAHLYKIQAQAFE